MLFKTISEIRAFVPANISNNIKTLEPAIRLATEEFIIPAIGKAQYEALLSFYDGGVSEETEAVKASLAALLLKVQLPLAHLLYYTGLATLNVSITDAGLQIIEGDGWKAANPWQVDDLRRHFCENGFKGLDYLLTFLEENQENYALWKASEAYTLERANFINSVRDFNRQLQINNSRFTFQALRPNMSRVEDLYLKPALNTFYSELKSRIRENVLVPGDAEVIALAQPAVAYFTAASAILELSVEITASGFMISPYRPVVTTATKQMEINLTASRREKYEQLGNMYLKDLVDYLNANASAELYASYYLSPVYQAPGTADKDIYQPKEGGIYAAF